MIKTALQNSAEIVQSVVKEGILNPPKTGRIWRKYWFHGPYYQASAGGIGTGAGSSPPSEYPQNRTGRLYRSIKVIGPKATKVHTFVMIGTSAKSSTSGISYPYILEFGREGKHPASPRFLLRHSLEVSLKHIEQSFRAVAARGPWAFAKPKKMGAIHAAFGVKPPTVAWSKPVPWSGKTIYGFPALYI